MRRYLVVAHQTLDSPELLELIRDRSALGASTFHLVVPLNHGGGLTWSEGQVRIAAARALEDARLHLTALGYAVSGEVGDESPVTSVETVLRREGEDRYDEIIVSTLPHKVSAWLGMDVPARVRRATKVPVTHLEAEMAHH